MENRGEENTKFSKGIAKIERIIKGYAPESIVMNCVSFLDSRKPTAISEIKKHPWLVFLLIKWTLTDKFVRMQHRPNIPQKEFFNAINTLIKLSGEGRLPSEYEHPTLFLRAISFQQFPYQHDYGYIDLARQYELFNHVDSSHFYHTEFLKITGITIQDFILLSYLTLGLASQPGPFKRVDFFNICKGFPPVVVDLFLRAVSVDLNDLPSALIPFTDHLKRPNNYFSLTPLLQLSPILKLRSSYFSSHSIITGRFLGHFIYDKLKKSSETKFQDRFGKTFESYVCKLIAATGLTFKDEKQIESSLTGEGKVIDFMIQEPTARIFIDAKGVELAKKGMFTHLRDIAKSAVKTSLLKAYEQGQTTSARMLLSEQAMTGPKRASNNFLIAVTYKELYIGNGETLALAIGDEALNIIDAKIEQTYGIAPPIPRDHIYFLTINEFEVLAKLVEDKKISFSKALERARDADIVPKDKKFVFNLHIHSWKNEFSIVHPLKEKSIELSETMFIKIGCDV